MMMMVMRTTMGEIVMSKTPRRGDREGAGEGDDDCVCGDDDDGDEDDDE